MRTYTFHVSLPGFGRLWRKIEMPSDSTLEDLHFAIQDAYDFNADHLYSFFMSGRAWDAATEYRLPEEAISWGLPEWEGDEGEEAEAIEDAAPEEGPEGLPAPTTAEILEVIAGIRDDPAMRDQLMQIMTREYGVPEALAELAIDHAEAFLQPEPGDDLADLFGDEAMRDYAGDVRETTLESLGLTVGRKFMYLFDYGDEWRFTVRVSAVNENADPNETYPRLVEAVGVAPAQYGSWEDEEDEAEWDE